MDIELKKEIEEILEGKASVERAQKCLTEITDDNLKKLFPDEEQKQLTRMLDEYKKRNNITPSPIPDISLKEKKEMWQKIKSAAEKPHPIYIPIWTWIKKQLSNFPVPRPSFASAIVMIILIILPFIILNRLLRDDYQGQRGIGVLPQATLKLSIVGPDNKLYRPDRVLTEEDRLAFRVRVNIKGYCSLYMLNKDKIDLIIGNKFFDPGDHDLKIKDKTILYNLIEKKGLNKLVLFFSVTPIPLEEKEKQEHIIRAARNNESSIKIDEQFVAITHEEIVVK
ncbi:MAG: hypothetical protein ACMUJM_02895 [bacterium]